MQNGSSFIPHTTDLWEFYVAHLIKQLDGGENSPFLAWTDDGYIARPSRRLELGMIEISYSRGRLCHSGRIGEGFIGDHILQGRWLTGINDIPVPIDAFQSFLGNLDDQLLHLGFEPLTALFTAYLPLPVAFGIKAACQSVDDPVDIRRRLLRWSNGWRLARQSRQDATAMGSPANSNVASLDTGVDPSVVESVDRVLDHFNLAQSLMAELSNHLAMGYQEASRIRAKPGTNRGQRADQENESQAYLPTRSTF